MKLTIFTLAAILFPLLSSATADDGAKPVVDKTLVAWVQLANTDQSGGSALSIDDRSGGFDGIVFGELAPKKWMAGSNGFNRTCKEQDAWLAETAKPQQTVQMAIVYHGREVTIYRDGELYAKYEMKTAPLEFGPQSVLVLGQRHLEGGSKCCLAGSIRDARVYDKPLAQDVIRSLKPCRASDVKPWAWLTFDGAAPIDRTKRFTKFSLEGDARIQNGLLVLGGGSGMLMAHNGIVESGDKSVAAPGKDNWLPGKQHVPRSVVESTRALREYMLSDPYRPGYHFVVPEDRGLPGDPNGALFFNGRYHLMYLYHNGKGYAWGHVSSTDMLHWRHHPVALTPGDGDNGIFSGGAFVDKEGVPTLTYWALPGTAGSGIGIARSTDKHLDRWTKSPDNPVVKSTTWGFTVEKDSQGKEVVYGSADPSQIWIKDGRYYMLTGNLLVLEEYGKKRKQKQHLGDTLYLLVSDDMKDWKYLHQFYKSDRKWTHEGEDNMCPSFLPLPSSPNGGPPSDKYLLLFISHCEGCQYYIGTYKNDRFTPERHGRMTWVDNAYFAPEALMDDQGRQIMWTWVHDGRPDDERKKRGWTGTYGLPRSLWLGEDGTLRMRAVKELQALRYNPREWKNVAVKADGLAPLENIHGQLLELEIDMTPGPHAKKCGVKVLRSPDGQEETLVYYDAVEKKLCMDTRKSGLGFGRKTLEMAPFELKKGETLKLRVFVDKSIVEVFANDRQAVCRRVYPTLGDSVGVALFSEGGPATANTVKSWEMMPSNPY